jgi:hypothetical protein
MDPAVKREHRSRVFRASGGILTLAVAAVGAKLMYDTLVRRPELSGADFLLGALACSSALVVFFLIVRPGVK